MYLRIGPCKREILTQEEKLFLVRNSPDAYGAARMECLDCCIRAHFLFF